MRIISWNVNGIRAIARKGFVDWFAGEAPDILCLQETKAHPDQLSSELLSVRGYKSYWNHPERKGYAGVAVYTKKEPDKVEYDFPSGDIDTEGRSLFMYYDDMVLVNVYFPNGGSGPDRLAYKLEFYERFLSHIDSMGRGDIIFCGDVNTAHKEIDLARPRENRLVSGFLEEERAWIDKVIHHGYADVFREYNKDPEMYTWWDYKTRARERNVGWRIDYFFAAGELLPRISSSGIMSEVEGSDHCPIDVILD